MGGVFLCLQVRRMGIFSEWQRFLCFTETTSEDSVRMVTNFVTPLKVQAQGDFVTQIDIRSFRNFGCLFAQFTYFILDSD